MKYNMKNKNRFFEKNGYLELSVIAIDFIFVFCFPRYLYSNCLVLGDSYTQNPLAHHITVYVFRM